MSDYGIEIVCDEPFHDGARVHLDVLSRHGAEWSSANARITYLAGDVPLTPAAREQWAFVEASRPGAVRRHYSLRCSCGVNVSTVWEKLVSKLDVLAEHGVPRVSITNLSSILI
jgi:hypothetical protein